MVELLNSISKLYSNDSTLSKRVIKKIDNIRLQEWNKVFGDKSPWTVLKRNGEIVVECDPKKVKNLGYNGKM